MMATTRYPYDDVGALGGLFAPAYIAGDPVSQAAVAKWTAAHQKSPPPPDPPFKMPTTSKDLTDQQRNAIVSAIVGQQIQGVGPGGPSISSGFTSLGKGDPDNPTVAAPDTAPPNQTAPPAAPPTAPPTAPDKADLADLGQLGPAMQATFSAMNPTMTAPAPAPVTSPFDAFNDFGVVANNPDVSVSNTTHGYTEMTNPSNVAPAPATGEKGSPFEGPVAPIGPPAPPTKGEPTAEEDAAELAAVDAQATAEGFMGPEGEPGPGVTTTTQSIGPHGELGPVMGMPTDSSTIASITGFNNAPPGIQGFAPAPPGPLGLTVAAPPAPNAPTGPLGQTTAQGLAAQAAAALAEAQQAQQDTAAMNDAVSSVDATAPTSAVAEADPGAPQGMAPGIGLAQGMVGSTGPAHGAAEANVSAPAPPAAPTGPQAAVAPAPTQADKAEAFANAIAMGPVANVNSLADTPQAVTNDAIAQTAVDNAMAAMNSNIGFQTSNMAEAQAAMEAAPTANDNTTAAAAVAEALGAPAGNTAATDAAGLGLGVGPVGGFAVGPSSGVPGEVGAATVGAPGEGVDGFGAGATGIAGVSGAGDLGGGIGIGGLGGLGGLGGEGEGGEGGDE
jgi:hypothetical protein